MSTATTVPQTRGELEGDEALATLRSCGRRALVRDAIARFRAADGFSHSRALAFQVVLALVPMLIAIVGGAAAVEQEDVRRVVQDTLSEIAPGPIGDLLTGALRQGSATARAENGEVALVAGGFTALVAGATALAQVERGANRLYGVERDRPFVRKYLLAGALAAVVGGAVLAALALLVAGRQLRTSLGLGDGADLAWDIARYPLSVVFVVGALALLFEVSPRRRQPEPSWLAFGAAVSAVLWVVFMLGLKLYVEVLETFGATYGPLAGFIGVLLWAFATAVALFAGVAVAAQLEAVRAGVPEPRVAAATN